MFYLRLFGGVVLSGLDGPLPHPITQQRVLAALAILAAAPSGRLSRDQLAELLWPDKASRNARHRLADTLHQLRKALGHEIIRSAGNDVELNRKVLSSDVHEFEAAFRAGNFDRSVALYRGPFADGFFVSHAPDFERWVDGTRQRLAQCYAEAVQELAAQAEARGDRAAALRWSRAIVLHEPYNARGVVRLMEALIATGDRAGALAQADGHAAVLRDQLDLDPDPAVSALAAKLRTAENVELRPAAVRSLVVLPFANFGPPDDEYLSDGITEELIHALAQVPGLRVAARTSSFAFKGKDNDVREIGRILGVDALLEGGIRRDQHHLRVTARLIGLGSGCQVWSARYDRHLSDVLRLQDEIAGAIVDALRVRLPPSGPGGLSAHTPDPEAHDRYLRGRYLLNTRTREGMLKAVDCFERALSCDPEYARAHAGLAEAWLMLGSGNHGVLAPQDALERARQSAERALGHDALLAEAHVALGIVYMHSWEWNLADACLRRAIELDPHNAAAHHRLGWLLAITGDVGRGLAQVRRAQELDPLSLPIRNAVGRIYEFMGRLNDAVAQYRHSLELDPNCADAYCGLGTAYLKKGLNQEAIAALRRAHDLAYTPGLAALLAFGLAAGGHTEPAREFLDQMKRSGADGAPAAHVGDIHFALGEPDEGFAWYERAYQQRSPTLMYLRADPMWPPMRSDSRFQDLLQRVGLSV